MTKTLTGYDVIGLCQGVITKTSQTMSYICIKNVITAHSCHKHA